MGKFNISFPTFHLAFEWVHAEFLPSKFHRVKSILQLFLHWFSDLHQMPDGPEKPLIWLSVVVWKSIFAKLFLGLSPLESVCSLLCERSSKKCSFLSPESNFDSSKGQKVQLISVFLDWRFRLLQIYLLGFCLLGAVCLSWLKIYCFICIGKLIVLNVKNCHWHFCLPKLQFVPCIGSLCEQYFMHFRSINDLCAPVEGKYQCAAATLLVNTNTCRKETENQPSKLRTFNFFREKSNSFVATKLFMQRYKNWDKQLLYSHFYLCCLILGADHFLTMA